MIWVDLVAAAATSAFFVAGVFAVASTHVASVLAVTVARVAHLTVFAFAIHSILVS